MELTFTKPLQDSGLGLEQAVVYELLLQTGGQTASTLVKNLPIEAVISRSQVYKVLDELMVMDLVEKNDPAGSVATFLPKHPVAIARILEEKEAYLEKSKGQYQSFAPKLTSLFNLASGKPGVQFYEGEKGVEEVLRETLQNKDEIVYSYADTDAIDEYVDAINVQYIKERKAKGVQKRILMMDSASAREKAKNVSGDLTEIKVISADKMPSVPAVLEVHNNKVTYITFLNGILTATVISDPTIYTLHRFMFESHWNCAYAPKKAVEIENQEIDFDDGASGENDSST